MRLPSSGAVESDTILQQVCFSCLTRPTLADDLKVGFFSLDRTTQTEESEIVHLKQMTDVVQQLLQVSPTRSLG